MEKISQDLHASIFDCIANAQKDRHEVVTVEHLLQILLYNSTVVPVLQAYAIDIVELRSKLKQHLMLHMVPTSGTSKIEPRPTTSFQRAIQRAIIYARRSNSQINEVTGAHVLIAIFGERGSAALQFLQEQGLTSLEVTTFIQNESRKK